MYPLFLVLVIPVGLLLAVIALAVLMLVASVALEFPLALLAAIGLGLLIHNLSKISSKPSIPCQHV